MHRIAWAAFLLASHVSAHGGHDESASSSDSGKSYMERHMGSEHHIDSFDPLSFFNLHDLNRDGILDRSELEAIYGVHHEKSRSNSQSDQHHQERTDEILKQVLQALDMNGDNVVTKTEFLDGVKRGGLPDFEDEGLGHHYPEEDEYFLHHEEMYHNTPETQTDESYTHPEDIEHFANHEAIEAEEERLIMKAQGLDADGNPLPKLPVPQPDYLGQLRGQVPLNEPPAKDPNEEERQIAQRQLEALQKQKKYSSLSQEAAKRGSWDQGSFRRPKDPADRLRGNLPYKFKVRGSFFGDF